MFVALLADQCNLTGALAVHIYGAKCRPATLTERLDGITMVYFLTDAVYPTSGKLT